MFLTHENKCVNMDNIDSMEVAHRDLYNDYIIEIRKNNAIILCIYSSGHMTYEECKFVYDNLLTFYNGYEWDDEKELYFKTGDKTNLLIMDEEEVDIVIRVYHEKFEKKENKEDE